VRRYLDGHMFRLPAFVNRNPELQEEIKVGIVQTAQGMFLLAQLHLDALIGKRSPKTIRTSLLKLPTGTDVYDRAYRDAMNRIERQLEDQTQLAKLALLWITCAKRPITSLELQHALAVEVGESTLDQDNLPQVEDILSVSAGLIAIDDKSGIIRLVHHTTQEYFERTQKQWFPAAEIKIATICIAYLSFNIFEAGFCDSNEAFEERLRSNPLYDYAAHNWGHHARDSSIFYDGAIEFLEDMEKVNASAQALTAVRGSWNSRYSQDVPKQMVGLHLAAYFGIQEARYLLQRRQSVDVSDSFGRTPLLWAAAKGHEAAVQLFLDKDANFEAKDNDGRTPLAWAAMSGHEAVILLLLDKGADFEAKDKYGWTPLWWAVMNGHEAIIRLLLDTGVEFEVKDSWDQTPLSFAAEKGLEASIQLLLDKGADFEARDYNGQTPLSWAARKGHKGIVQLLLDKGANFEAKDRWGFTPLSWAAEREHEAVIQLLLNSGADFKAIKEGDSDCISRFAEKLDDSGPYYEMGDNYGQVPLLD